MSMFVAVWINHRQARIVRLDSESNTTKITAIDGSDVESHHKSRGGTGTALPSHLGGSRETHDDRRRQEQLKRFYRSVLAAINDADSFDLLGPGEARLEFAALVEKDKSGTDRIKSRERCDNLTDSELIARTRELFEARMKKAARPLG